MNGDPATDPAGDVFSAIPDLDAIAERLDTTVFAVLATDDPELRSFLDAAAARIVAEAARVDRSHC